MPEQSDPQDSKDLSLSENDTSQPTKASAAEVASPNTDAPSMDAPKDKRPGRGLAVIACVLAVIAILIAIWAVWQLQQQGGANSELASSTAKQSARVDSLRGDLSKTQARLDEVSEAAAKQSEIKAALSGVSGQVGALGSSVGDNRQRMDQLETSLAEIRQRLGGQRRAWLESEVQYLLRFANDRMQLFHDHSTALRALEAADKRLLELSDPALNGVRQQVRSEIAAVKGAAKPDTTGIALSLAALNQQVPKLALKRDPAVAFQKSDVNLSAEELAAKKDWKEMVGTVWTEMKSLVVIRRDDSPYEPLMAPEAEFFLYQNLQLKLATARLALLEDKPELFRSSLRVAQEWLEAWYDSSDSQVKGLHTQLGEFVEAKLTADIPDLSRSLAQLRKVIEQRDTQRSGS